MRGAGADDPRVPLRRRGSQLQFILRCVEETQVVGRVDKDQGLRSGWIPGRLADVEDFGDDGAGGVGREGDALGVDAAAGGLVFFVHVDEGDFGAVGGGLDTHCYLLSVEPLGYMKAE